MGRAKLRMELITKDKTRNTTYHKRKHGIIKKAHEFTVLCDVDTVIIIYPSGSNQPEIWPQNPDQINKTIAFYKAKKGENGKKTYDLNDFFQDRKKKIQDELVKARKRNMEAKYPTWFDELNGLSEGQLRHFAIGLENKETIVRAQLQLRNRNINFNAQMQMPMPMPMPYRYELGNNYAQMPMPYRYELQNNQPFMHYEALYPSLDQVQAVNLNHDLGWLGHPVIEGGMVNYNNPNPCAAFQPVAQCSQMLQELGLQDSQVNHDGVGDYVMDASHRGGGFMHGLID